MALWKPIPKNKKSGENSPKIKAFFGFFGTRFFRGILKILQKCYNIVTIKLQTKEMRGKYD